MKKKPSLFDKGDPYTGAYYFHDSMKPLEVQAAEGRLMQKEQPHLHDEIEMLLITEGNAILTVNGAELPMPTGSLAWLFPFHVHSLRPADARGTVKFLYCRFSLGMLLYLHVNKRYMNLSLNMLEYAPPCIPLGEADARRAKDTFEELVRENAERLPDWELLLFSSLLRLIVLFERKASPILKKNQEQARPLMWNVLQYIHVHYNKKIDSAAVAAVFHISVSELNCGLRLLTNMNFSQNLNEVRIRNACAMMQFEELSIQFIARSVGYPSIPVFYRRFKELKGITPEQYRKGMAGQAPDYMRFDSTYSILIYIIENYREDITAETAAAALYFSEATISGLLEKAFRCSFSELVAKVRLWMAAGILLDTELPVTDIAIAVGFNSIRTFTRRFTDEFGASPTAFRESGTREGRGRSIEINS